MKIIKQFGLCAAAAFFIVATPAFAATSDYTNFWSFDDAAGHSVADTGGQHGVITGSSTGLGWASGKIGTSLGMDGLTGEGVTLPNGFLTGSQGTLSTWFRIEELSDRNVIFSGKSTSDNNIYVLLSIDRDGRPQMQFRTDPTGSDHKAQGVAILNRNEWYNLVLTANTVSYKMYVNGIELAVAGENIGRWFPDFTNQTLSYRIGASEAYPLVGSWNGMLDEVRIYNRVLTQDDVTALYEEGNAGRPTAPLSIRPVLSFTISSETIMPKDAVTLSWSSANVDTCSASGDWSGVLLLSGSRVMSDISTDAAYSMTCTGKGGPIESTVRVHVGTSSEGAAVGSEPPTVPGVVLPFVPTVSETPLFVHDLSVGVRGGDVKQMQLLLIQDGVLADGLSSGYFGTLTKEAVMKFQEKRGVPATGYVGPLTRGVLNTLGRGTLTVTVVTPTTEPAGSVTLTAGSGLSNAEIDTKIAAIMKLIAELQKQLAVLRAGN
ncbi:MAG: hypothetical protein A2845_03675 [Candidatus Lloydbacteria bacterium RIFCSPHIGHO2_01_FULL_49_22]|uniref:Peptidoglycan binding-like domain-containing protein n=1 Tax=Candidatus Lloydbacteria bacterium RIFCSPHIGHO2_01_FULL_49_22 TaxID=1798658 RepID=A0A1G2CWY2_9BACT|nr:MAG: hypothetical protein A2845_03675 [Candidatus Lloydbacteria bacterium RIFCSPHIGHO2_01_FULL_49_22]OGZ09029.1 MAG: hypothetical protein A3C14_03510 [Candidatus Lloydbacteria bacterium RIFCSPHIGHO2_02_FULL_50_18]